VTWSSVTSGESLTLLGIGTGPDGLFVTLPFGIILRSTDGEVFTRAFTPESVTELGTAVRSSAVIEDQLFIVGSNGLIARSADGETFETLASGTTNGLNSIMKEGSTLYVVGDSGTLLTSSDGGD